MKKLDEIVDIMESGNLPTDEQLKQLCDDPEMLAAAEDVMLVHDVLTPKPDDIESRLAQFHNRKRRKLWRIVAVSVAAAAMFAGVLWGVYPKQKDSSLLFQAQQGANVAMLTDEDGNEMPLDLSDTGIADPVVVAGKNTGVVSGVRNDTLRLSLPQGHSCRLDLPDGSKVYLHPGSEIFYPNEFGPKSRDVRLKGEAFFVIAKDKSRPFNVITSQSVTSVLGTQFNLCSKEGASEELVLVDGRVRFSDASREKSVNVLPGQLVNITADGNLNVQPTDTMVYTSWRDGFIYYDEAEFGDILKQIGLTYNVNIACHNPQLLHLHMHFVLSRDKDIYSAVKMLNKMKKVHATLKDNTLIVK